MSALSLEAGKFYRTRAGREVGPMVEVSNPSGPGFRAHNGNQDFTWWPDGSAARGTINPGDLVAEAPCQHEAWETGGGGSRTCSDCGASLPIPSAPWPVGPDNGKRRGWAAYFEGRKREDCPFPPARADLRRDYEEGWDVAFVGHEPPAVPAVQAERAELEWDKTTGGAYVSGPYSVIERIDDKGWNASSGGRVLLAGASLDDCKAACERDAGQFETAEALIIIAMAKAHDREESAQKGEPSPWREDLGAIDDGDWREERFFAMREAFDVAKAALVRSEVEIAKIIHPEAFEEPEDGPEPPIVTRRRSEAQGRALALAREIRRPR